MKYIRTKGGIFDITGKIIKDTYYGLKQNEVYIGCDYRQANTIEELCDEFVVVANEFPFHFINPLCGEVFNRFDRMGAKITGIYGAIWTDKGLIYAAELNKEGEWKLI